MSNECRGIQLVYTKSNVHSRTIWKKSVGVNWSVLKPRDLTDRQFHASVYNISVKPVRKLNVRYTIYSADHVVGNVHFYPLPVGCKFNAIGGLLVNVKANIERGEEAAPRDKSFDCYKKMWLPPTGQLNQCTLILTECLKSAS